VISEDKTFNNYAAVGVKGSWVGMAKDRGAGTLTNAYTQNLNTYHQVFKQTAAVVQLTKILTSISLHWICDFISTVVFLSASDRDPSSIEIKWK
jgi:hypothetical protein